MPVLAAFLRAINVGGTGKLPMKDLVALCEAAGLASVRTYIASGNVVFATALDAAEVEARLGRALLAYMGKPVGLALRTAEELEAVLALNPFTAHDAKAVTITFLPAAPAPNLLDTIVRPDGEELALGPREVFVHYPAGMGTSTLKLPFAKHGTARNLGTVRAVLALVREVEAATPTTSKATAKAKRPTAKTTTAKASAAKTPAKGTTAKVPRAAASTTTPRARRPR
jgi:uncharacterized protein (DUF1697 family)